MQERGGGRVTVCRWEALSHVAYHQEEHEDGGAADEGLEHDRTRYVEGEEEGGDAEEHRLHVGASVYKVEHRDLQDKHTVRRAISEKKAR
jgi:hypothetical protein